MSLRKKLGAVAITGAAAAAMIVIPATAANAASPCRDAGFTRTTPWGYTKEVFFCRNVAPQPVYAGDRTTSPRVGTLTSSTSWFICVSDIGENNGSRPHPNRWLYTLADTPSGAWGYVPDKLVISETDSIPNICFF
jgi:hypothetical protein